MLTGDPVAVIEKVGTVYGMQNEKGLAKKRQTGISGESGAQKGNKKRSRCASEKRSDNGKG